MALYVEGKDLTQCCRDERGTSGWACR